MAQKDRPIQKNTHTQKDERIKKIYKRINWMRKEMSMNFWKSYKIYLFWCLKIATKSGNTHTKDINLMKSTQRFKDNPTPKKINK